MTIYKYEMSVRNCGMSCDQWLCMVCDTQLTCSQILRLVNEHVREPYTHMGNIRMLPKEGGHGMTMTTDGSIHHINNHHKGVHPQEAWGIHILHNGVSLIQNLPVCMFSNATLLRHVWGCELHYNTIPGTILLQHTINVLTASVRLKDLGMCAVVV